MADSRFYEMLGPRRLADLAEIAGARLHNPADADFEILSVAPIEAGGPGDLGYLDSTRHLSLLKQSGVSAVLVSEADAAHAEAAGVRLATAPRPQEAFARACAALIKPRVDDFGPEGVHSSVTLGEDVVILPGARIAQDVRIGARTRIGPNAVIGVGVEIGPDCDIGPCAVVRFAELGARVRVHAGAVIGENGYGLAHGEHELIERPHVGRVTIGDDVRIGACTTVDRGVFADTTIGASSKIDNLVQIAHNVQVGRACVIAGCTGVSGSAVIEDGAMLGGSVGVSDHVRVGAGARLAGATLVMRDVPAGESWSGSPARPIRQFFREIVALQKLARRGGGS